MKDREFSANPKKMKNNKDREVVTGLEQSKQRKILHKGRFCYIPMFFCFAF